MSNYDNKEALCFLCNTELSEGGSGYAVPIYEGKIAWSSHVAADVCEECYYVNPYPGEGEASNEPDKPTTNQKR